MLTPEIAAGLQFSRNDLGPTYRSCDLLAYRDALALRREELADLLRVAVDKQGKRERGNSDVGLDLAAEMQAIENLVENIAGAAVTAALTDQPTPVENESVKLTVAADQDEFAALYPGARTLQDGLVYPVSLQHVAIGRAAADLTRRGHQVEVYRADRRVDLMVRRASAGLFKNETVDLLRVDKKHYYRWELGQRPPPANALAELQAVNDFIAATASRLEVHAYGDVEVLQTYDDRDQHRFEADYPHARTLVGTAAYPARMHRVAAARRAHEMIGAGRPVRIAMPR
ncbi:hypothetical protein [Mycobacteroides abscessus]|uniref:hypothetical protein n=1 Tax=Mycobacteroides abscessus TaxID=36809 RepID=UPI0010C951E5|nr:hypothetical protein [Mycobacteroides abscessus]TKV35398.1 hypothetical protein CFA71_24365 [Mycobacteroides abscessus subsp. bolletii]